MYQLRRRQGRHNAMHMVCMIALVNAMNACTCVFITRLSMLCFNYTHSITFKSLARWVYVNACMNAMNACAQQYSNHSPIQKCTWTIYN